MVKRTWERDTIKELSACVELERTRRFQWKRGCKTSRNKKRMAADIFGPFSDSKVLAPDDHM